MAARDAAAASVTELLAACTGDVARVRELLENGAPASAQIQASGESRSCGGSSGSAEIVSLLLERGAPWNALDRKGRCAGEFAVDAQSQECVDLLVNAASARSSCSAYWTAARRRKTEHQRKSISPQKRRSRTRTRRR